MSGEGVAYDADLYGPLPQDGRNALQLYGEEICNREHGAYGDNLQLTPAVLEERRALLQHAYDEGPHPNAFFSSPKQRSLGSPLAVHAGHGLQRLPPPARETAHPADSEPPVAARLVNSTRDHLDRGSAEGISEHGGVRARRHLAHHRLIHLSNSTIASSSQVKSTKGSAGPCNPCKHERTNEGARHPSIDNIDPSTVRTTLEKSLIPIVQ